MKIEQKHYPEIEIIDRKPDIVEIWMNSSSDSNVIKIEREKLMLFIAVLVQIQERQEAETNPKQ